MFIDLDNFKRVNDTLGHKMGDELLKNVPLRIVETLRKSDNVARLGEEEVEKHNVSRWGGDEFIVVLSGIASIQDVSKVAERITEKLRNPYLLDYHQIYSTPSIGIAIFSFDGMDAETLFMNADTAMYAAKNTGKNSFQFFLNDMNKAVVNRVNMELKLRKALENQELVLYYQPQIDLTSGSIVAAEVLIRWRHLELGLVSPIEFIPLAEETGLIVPIGQWILETACRKMADWQGQGLNLRRLSVNLSARQFQENTLRNVIAGALLKVNLQPECLELEITETLLMRDADAAVVLLETMRNIGVSIALDDFGTGYSSLSYLKRFPIDRLKIDQTFVRDSIQDMDSAQIITAIIAMAQSLKLETIAEGVETQEQMVMLKHLKCDFAQGYLISRPLPEDKFLHFVQGYHPNPG